MADAMKLLPCPVCGGEAVLLDYEARYGGLHYASRCPQCASCGCSMGYLPTAKKAVEAWNCRASMPAPEKTPSFDDARRKLIHCIEQWDGETEYDAEDIAALADHILDVFASPPAREEAPAEGAGEREEIARIIDPAAFLFAQDELMKGDTSQFNAMAKADRILALRNRTSEPAREAVAWRWRLTKNAAGLHRDSRVSPQWQYMEEEVTPARTREVQPLYLHPAPATADKLPDDVRRLVLAARAVAFGPDCGRNAVIDALDKASEAFADHVPWDDQPLAALNEQPQ